MKVEIDSRDEGILNEDDAFRQAGELAASEVSKDSDDYYPYELKIVLVNKIMIYNPSTAGVKYVKWEFEVTDVT